MTNHKLNITHSAMVRRLLAMLCVLAIFCCCFAFAACNKDDDFQNPGDKLNGGGTGSVSDSVDTSENESEIEEATQTIDFDKLSANTTYSDDAQTIAATDEAVEISESGTYIFSGTYSGGIKITAKSLDLHFVFNGAAISSDAGIAIDGSEYKKTALVITLVDGTSNSVENSSDNAIQIKGSISINGKGTLNVTSNGKNGIKASKELQIVDCALNISAENHALAALSVAAKNCTINVTAAGKDGINAECDDETTEFTLEEGFVVLQNVTYTCDVDGDGIQADTFVCIDGGTYNIKTTGEFVAKTSDLISSGEYTADDFRYVKSGSTYKKVASDENGTYALEQSCKGIKVGEIEYPEVDSEGNETGEEITVTEGNYSITIASGTFTIDTTDDAVHANCGDIYIYDGTIAISTYDDGVTADCNVKISGGDLNITSCYEGVEGATVEISGGTVNIVASDDGINAASDDESATMYIIISGGTVTVNADGDGIDSNGGVLISGGTTTVFGPTNGGNGGLDSETGVIVTGGTLFVSSALGMVETPSTNSTQYVVSYAQKNPISANTNFYVADSDGNVLLELTIEKSCQSLIFSTNELTSGESYTIFCGDTEMATFTVNSTITTVGTSTQSNNPGGRPDSFGPGGGRR